MKGAAFRTQGSIPIEAFTMTGINVKLHENPIGYFGTGLKYAVAVLARHGLRMRVFVDGVEYEFYTRRSKFRGVDFDFLMMKKRKSLTGRWGACQLSYTTEYGKNWELWQVLRELESNTRDEAGASWLITTESQLAEVVESSVVARGHSTILIEGEAFAEVYHQFLSNIFLPEQLMEPRLETPAIRIYNQPSKHLYYRGLRVYDLEIPAKYTYNIVSQHELTEDRTLKYVYSARATVARALVRCTDKQLIREIATAGANHFEDKIDFDFVYESPSKEFMEVIRDLKYSKTRLGGGFGLYYDRYNVEHESPRVRRAKLPIVDQWREWLKINNPFDDELTELVGKTIDRLESQEKLIAKLRERSVPVLDGGE
jgi:hypothetical protein